MHIHIFRVDVTLHRGDRVFAKWTEWSYEPSEYELRDPIEGFQLERAASRSIGIEVPVGSALAGAPKRLKTYFAHPPGLDATNVWHLASRGERDFRLVNPPEIARKVVGRVARVGDPS